MQGLKTVGLLCAAFVCYAYAAEEPSEPAAYKFDYAVNDPTTGDQKDQQETRDGDNVVGYYRTLDSDGMLRTVHYRADPVNGFTAEVAREPVAGVAVPAPAVAKAVVAKAVVAPVVAPVPVAVKVPAPSAVVPAPAPYYFGSAKYPYNYQPYSYGYQPYPYDYSPYSYGQYPYSAPYSSQYISPIVVRK